MTAARRRVEAAARALAEQWCDNPAQMVEAMKVTMRDAATLERLGLLADPPGPCHGDVHPASTTDTALRCVDADRGIYRATRRKDTP